MLHFRVTVDNLVLPLRARRSARTATSWGTMLETAPRGSKFLREPSFVFVRLYIVILMSSILYFCLIFHKCKKYRSMQTSNIRSMIDRQPPNQLRDIDHRTEARSVNKLTQFPTPIFRVYTVKNTKAILNEYQKIVAPLTYIFCFFIKSSSK